MGDGLLADFASAVNAVACAVEIQENVSRHEAELPDEARIKLRIGINLGDIILEAGDIFGDGVNIAARLEGLAEPGGICISGTAFDTVEGKLSFEYEDLGPQWFKNIDRPVRAYRVLFSTAMGVLSNERKAQPSSPDRPSIAVLPFVNLSADQEQQYFSDGITEDIITNLAKCRWIFVISRNSTTRYSGEGSDVARASHELGVRYILQGSVRRSGAKVRITSQLIDVETGDHLWAERFDRTMTDIFELQDEITRNVVALLEPTLKQAEIARIRRKKPDNLNAYELYLQALEHMYDKRPEGRAAALDLVSRAIRIDPNYAEAHGIAAWCYFAKSLWEGSLPDPHRQKMLHHARAVQGTGTEDASTLAHAAIALALATRDYATALSMIDRAISFNPSSAHAFGHGSVICTWAGLYDRSIELSDTALRLSPFDPLGVMPLAGQAGARLMKDDYRGAVSYAERALQIYATHTPSFLIMIASLVRLGCLSEAKEIASRLMAVSPGYRILPNAPIFEFFTSELAAAGLSEMPASG
jgi:adenylate cyclase